METKDIAAAGAEWAAARGAQGADPVVEAPAPATIETPAPAADLPPAAALPSSAASPADLSATPESTAEAIAEMIEAMNGTERMSLPANLTFALPTGGETQHLTLKEIRDNGLRLADYTRKRMADAEVRRQVDEQARQLRVADAAMRALGEEMTKERERMAKANNDPEEYERYLSHMQRLQSDPEYREVWETARRSRVRDAEDAAHRAISLEEEERNIVDDIEQTALEFEALPEFAGVSAADAVALYQSRLRAKEPGVDLTPKSLHKAFSDIAKQHTAVKDPLQRQLDEMRATIATLTAQKDADTTNATLRGRVPAQRVAAVQPTSQPNREAPVVPAVVPEKRIEEIGVAGSRWAQKYAPQPH